MNLKEISKKYECSLSNIYRIKSNIDYYSARGTKKILQDITISQKNKIIEVIKNFD